MSGENQIAFDLLEGPANYSTWRTKMESLLVIKGLDEQWRELRQSTAARIS